MMVSGTITDASGRTLSGQTVEAFWNSIRHAEPHRGGAQLRARRQAAAPVRRGALAPRRCGACAPIRMPACPMPSVNTTSRPARPPRLLREFAEQGLVNIVGGCCGTTAGAHRAHPRGRGPAAAAACRRKLPPRCRLSGLEALNIGPDSLFVNVGERTNVTGSAKFRRLIEADDYTGGAGCRARAGGERRADHRHQHG